MGRFAKLVEVDRPDRGLAAARADRESEGRASFVPTARHDLADRQRTRHEEVASLAAVACAQLVEDAIRARLHCTLFAGIRGVSRPPDHCPRSALACEPIARRECQLA